MNIYQHLDQLSPSVKFFKEFSTLEKLDLLKSEKWYAKAPASVYLFSKNSEYIYVRATENSAKLINQSSEENFIRLTDFDIKTRECYSTPQKIQEEDEYYMNGYTLKKNTCLFVQNNTPKLMLYKKVPIVCNKKSLGVACALIDITNTSYLFGKTIAKEALHDDAL